MSSLVSKYLLSVLIPWFIVSHMNSGFIRLILVMLTSLGMSMISIYFFGLKNNEKLLVQNAAVKVKDRLYSLSSKK